MRLSTKCRFAVTAMIDLALHEKVGPVALAAIGARHKISVSYLEQLFSKLRQHGLVGSTRGPGGGYSLGRCATTISVADIIAAVEGPLPMEATRKTANDAGGEAMTQALWDRLNHGVNEYLNSISLQQLAGEQHARGVRVEHRPVARSGVFAQPKPAATRTHAPNSVFALGLALVPRR